MVASDRLVSRGDGALDDSLGLRPNPELAPASSLVPRLLRILRSPRWRCTSAPHGRTGVDTDASCRPYAPAIRRDRPGGSYAFWVRRPSCGSSSGLLP